MTITREHANTSQKGTDSPLSMIWAEITGVCQLSCVHCYAGSGPDGTHGTMTPDDWERVLTEAAGLGCQHVTYIGGEPLMYPALPRLVRHALGLALEVEVYTNLVHVSPDLWELFELPGVHLATSWYSNDRGEHEQITGRDTFRQTLGNIEEATRRGVPLRVGMVDGIMPGQKTEEGERELRVLGVTTIGTDRLRKFGRGSAGSPDEADTCGACGHGNAAILPDGTVAPCIFTRAAAAGNVLTAPLGGVLTDGAFAAQVARLDSLRPAAWPCVPNMCDPQCGPSCGPACRPAGNCRPTGACAPDYR